MTTTNHLLDTALALHAAGLSVVPVAADGTKRPRIAWKQHTTTAATVEQLHGWFDNDALEQGIGLVTGFGGVEMLEVEGKAMSLMGDVLDLLDGSGLRGLYDQLVTGWSEQSPSGGLHLFYRITDADVPGNTKIAQRPVPEPPYRETLAETRGTGGFVVLAPSSGKVHDTGRPYVRLAGGPDTVPAITREQRDQVQAVLHAVMDSMPIEDPAPVAGPVDAKWSTSYQHADGDVTPGDDYENTTDWADILVGWTLVFTRGRTRYWRRPGKKDGISATTGRADDRDRLFVFTSSTEFEPEVPYTKFGAYALLQHRGDHAAAAKALADAGHGHRAPRQLTPPSRTTSTGTQLAVLGNTVPTGDSATVIGSDAADLTDDGNARLLVAEYAATLRYVPDAGKWVTWEGNRWKWHPDDGPAIEAARDVIRRIPTDNAMLKQWRLKSMRARAIADAVRLARSTPAMRIAAAQFDQHPWQLNTPAGVVDLRTGAIAAGTPGLFHSKQTSVAPDPEMPTPLWDQFLATTFQSNAPLERYVKRLAGLTLIGEVLEHILPFAHGPGGNGKGVFAEVLLAIAGDYGTTAPQGFLVAGRDKHETELANLQGRRIVVASEINENTRFDEAKVKQLTGGDTITARFMRQDFFDYIPSHTFWLLGNSQPEVQTGGNSFWRRLRLIPFTHIVPDEKKIENLQHRLVEEEGPGILHWIIEGAVDYAIDGLRTPDEVLAATSEYRAEEDHLGRFVEERCRVGGGELVRTETSELRRAYDAWCREQHEDAMSSQSFGRQLKQRFGIESTRSNGRRFYTNLHLYAPEGETDAAESWWEK
ncbi:phage/plasmid primase, P4 family [Microbacterium sp. AR7-10]|uniref:phage/plasmid primase, P4 family n=1 Tax=Microbacterium sp. AR7-10 TaxID=1891970 RepID=UPI0008FC97FA|nr:phage/plasmid primase, P4 family [Microbacterium sp. AR7-10]OIU88632.1 DNA primase [Microbacterium sp. AR7-10]